MIWEIDDSGPAIEGLDSVGRPDPAYAAALGLLRAPFGRRSLALVCDVVLWMLLQLPMWLGAVPLLLKLATGSISPYGFLNHPSFLLAVVMASVSTVLSLVFLIVQLVLHGRQGRTIGKAIAGIRSVNVRTLERPGVGAVLLRFLIFSASGIVPVLGPALLLSTPTFDPEGRGRGWHDKATGVWLVDARRGLNPYDEKRMRVARKMVKAEPTKGRTTLPSLATHAAADARSAYRPGNRISAGVLGVARPYAANERPEVGLAPASSESVQIETGKPVLGGYRGEPASAPAPLLPQTGMPSSSPRPPSTPAPAPAPAPQAAPQSATGAPPAPAAQPAAPAAQPAQPAPESPSAPAHRMPAARFGLRLDTGESILVSEPVLLGRNPDAAGHPGARPIALADDSRSLSKTHLLVRPVDGGLEIVDCRSTNGSGLVRAGVEYAVAAGIPVLTTDGDVIRLGDRVASVVRV
ncbi:RDD family protein [Microbacterium sp. GXF0217]